MEEMAGDAQNSYIGSSCAYIIANATSWFDEAYRLYIVKTKTMTV